MTPAQSRAARGLLNWTQEQFSVRAGVSVVTVRNFENEKAAPQRSTLAAIRAALESAGVEFIAENGGGAGVRLKVPAKTAEIRPGTMVKYRDGVSTPGARNIGVVGEVLDRVARLDGEVVVRWPSGEEAGAVASKLEVIVPSEPPA